MRFDPDLPPASRTSSDPAENKNRRDIARAKLMARNPASPEEWLARYERRFRELVSVSDEFRALLDAEPTPDNLVRIQERLDDPR